MYYVLVPKFGYQNVEPVTPDLCFVRRRKVWYMVFKMSDGNYALQDVKEGLLIAKRVLISEIADEIAKL